MSFKRLYSDCLRRDTANPATALRRVASTTRRRIKLTWRDYSNSTAELSYQKGALRDIAYSMRDPEKANWVNQQMVDKVEEWQISGGIGRKRASSEFCLARVL